MASKYYSGRWVNPAEIFKLKPLLACLRIALAGGVFCVGLPTVNAKGELPVPAETWVSAGSATQKVVGKNLNIDQTSDRAVLNWQSFNVGEKNAVNFQQLNASSIAMNRIGQNDPSKILGKVNANGQIYLYNQNGFVFGKGTQINANTLVATALDVSDDVILNGSIVTEYDNNRQRAAFSGKPGADVAIEIEKGAKIKVDENGRLIMVAPNISNSGDLEADKFGQILLVASKDKVYLQPADAASPFAGVLVEVDTGGKVSNLGNILSRQGNVTLAGFAVNQEGRVSATTSVNVNGSIRLIAREGETLDGDALAATRTIRNRDLNDGLGTQSKVTFGKDSVTKIVGDAEGGTAIDEQVQPLSYLEVMANTVHLQTASKIVAPGGDVNLTATGAPLDPAQNNQGRLLLDKGSTIDVSGNKDITAKMERNVVELSVQSFELRDSPLQKGGVLQGQTVKVDIRQENPIVDISGALARTERGIDERLGKAGTVNLTSGGDVIVNSKAKIDISGGLITYQEGFINTTKLITDYGSVVDIAQANPEEHYAGIYGLYIEDHPKWGVTRTWQVGGGGKGLFEQGYQEGLDAGALNIETSKLSWNGDLVAGSVSGFYQRSLGNQAFGGSLFIDTKTFGINQGLLGVAQNVKFNTSANNTDIQLDEAFPTTKDGSRPANLVLSSTMVAQSGIQQLTVKSLGKATLTEDTTLEMAPGSQFDLVANGIDVFGDSYIPSGSIQFSSGFDDQASETSQRLFNGLATLRLTSSSQLDVSGRWVNDLALGLAATPTETVALDGGHVNLIATSDLTANAQSEILADGGAWYTQNGQLSAGLAGSIALRTIGGSGVSTALDFKGKVSAYGLFEGGTLALESGYVVVGAADETDLANNPLVFDFNKLATKMPSIEGFGQINLTSNFGNLAVKAGTTVQPIQQNLVLNSGFIGQASTHSLKELSNAETLPEHLRNPVNLALAAENGVSVETGSQILADKGANVSLSTTVGSVYIDGKISAPAGNINLTVNDSPNPYDPKQSIWLGQNGQLLALGDTRFNPIDAAGRRTGEVMDGGTVNLTAKRGYIILEKGSKVDVSGTKATLDLLSGDAGSIRYTPTQVGSNGGRIELVAAEGGVLDGELRGFAGNLSTRAGIFDMALDRSIRNPNQEIIDAFPFNDLSLSVRQELVKTLPDDFSFGSNPDDIGLNGKAVVSVDQIKAGGFSDIRLATINTNKDGSLSENGSIDFLGNIDFDIASSINLDSPTINWRTLDDGSAAEVSLKTAYLRVGSSLIRNSIRQAETGDAVFTAHSQWTQLEGASRWSGFKTINLNSEQDLRTVGVVFVDRVVDGEQRSDYQGRLNTAADLNLTANQIYPSTLSRFTFAIENNPNGKITISPNGANRNDPLTAAGSLTFHAPVIEQNGVVKAPFGAINLVAGKSLALGGGSLTSVSGDGLLVPFGTTYSGLDWLYQIQSNNNLVFEAPPEKKLILSGPEINLQEGSVVDVSGGGDLLAYEFQPGIGGSFDYLASSSPSYNGGFAIAPDLGSTLAPYDHLQNGNYQAVGSQVYLSGTDELAAGFYTILPARYALLPGAFLVTPVPGSQDQRIASRNLAGLPIVPGFQRLAGTGAKDQRFQGYLIENGEDIRKHSQYDEQTANAFYIQKALSKDSLSLPFLPRDSGQISIQNAQTQLSLEGDLNVASSDGRGARMDISANQLKVVRELSQTRASGVLEILADDLSALSVDSLLLGGERRTDTATGSTEFDISSKEVTFAQDAQIQVTDLIAAATNKVTVQKGATIEASGSVNTGDSQFNVVGDGALLRVSADTQVALERTGDKGNRGVLAIEDGAVLTASKSILLDASQSTTLAGDIQMQGGSLNLSANAINLGEVDQLPTTTALNLSNEKLLSLAVDELILKSRNGIYFYGDVGEKQASGSIKPLTFDRLTMDSAGLAGFGAANQSANINANRLELSNTRDAVFASNGNGRSILNLSAMDYLQGEGNFNLNGFSATNFVVENGFVAKANATLQAQTDVNLTAGYFAANNGSTLEINASGYLVKFEQNPKNNVVVNGIDYGGSINVVANSIAMNANVALPSGRLGLHSLTGDVLVGSNAKIDLSGDAVKFADVTDSTPGGIFSAVADQGKITLAEGSNLDLNPGSNTATGGKMVFQAVSKNVELFGNINANKGSIVFDAANFGPGSSFDQLINQLAEAGVSDSVYIRLRDEAIDQVTSNIKANTITLVSDQAGINIAGKINADGQASTDGGSVNLYAGDGVVLKNGAEITARGAGDGANGGKVVLASTDADNDQINGIEIQAGSVIDVQAGKAGEKGKVLLRALRQDTNADGVDDGIAIMPIKGVVRGYSQFYAEGVKKYGNQALGDDGNIDLTDINRIKTDTDAYMAAATAQVSKLGDGMRLRPGIEINYDGDLTLAQQWDLVDWRFADLSGGPAVPGGLSINANGNLVFAQSLTDGFRFQSVTIGSTAHDLLQTDDSWSYQLAAGADLRSADKTALGNLAKDLTINAGSLIRTGTGDIQLSSSGDVNFGGKDSAVYVGGKAEEGNRYGSLGDFYVAFVFYGEYPLSGGDLSIRAGGDIQGALAQTPNFNNWFVRQGRWSERVPTAWGIDYKKFEQNIGAFGGGNISLSADGNINDLAVMMPTTGKQVGRLSDPNNQFSRFETNELDIQGSGQLAVTAGGDMAGGVYFLGSNSGEINVAGSITGSSRPQEFSETVRGLLNGPQFLLGDTRLDVTANSGITISAISDPMILHNLDVNFFSYSRDSLFQANSLSGDVVLNSDASVLTSGFPVTTGQVSLSKIYPASLNASAFGGNVTIGGTDTDIVLFPSAKGGLNIFAKDDVAAASAGIKRLGMSDYDPALLPEYLDPFSATDLQSDSNNIVAFMNPFSTSSSVHAIVPTHSADNVPVRIANQEGDIKNLIINLPKMAIVQSGRDLSNVSLDIQHANPKDDVSIIAAGQDIIYQTNRLIDFGTLEGNTNNIEIAGSGNVLVKSGRNIDLGTSIGLSTVGNTFNPNLPSKGANMTVLVGANGLDPDFLGLGNLDSDVLDYAENYDDFQILVTDFMRQKTGNPSLAVKTAFEDFYKLDPNEYASLQPALEALKSNQYYDILNKMESVIVKYVRERQGASLSRQEALNIFKGFDSQDYLLIQPRLNTLANRMLFSILNTTGSLVAVDGDDASRSKAVLSLNERLLKKANYSLGNANDFAPLIVGNESGFSAVKALYPIDRVYNLIVNPISLSEFLELHGNPESILSSLVEPQARQNFNQLKQETTQFFENWQSIDSSINNNNVIEEFQKLTPDEYLAIKAEIEESQQTIRPTYLADQAINPNYLGHEWNGDLDLFFSKVQTLRDGSIDLLVPGGEINAGLAVVASDLQKSSSDLGIVVQGKGGVNAFLNNDFIVNQSRVFALSGGDILIWSSVGDIDAGRGAKSAIAAPPPIISFDQSGNLVITFPPITSGSGIRTAAPVGENIPPGDVALYAPGGVVNAGEAGIAGNNVTIAATAVLGANNIQVGGVGTGVPAASAGSLAAGLTGVSNLTANVVQAAESSLTDMERKREESAEERSMKLGTLSIDLVGFGDGSGGSAADKKNNN